MSIHKRKAKIDIKTRLTGWRLRLSFSLQWLFWSGTAVHRSFWCFHGSVLLLWSVHWRGKVLTEVDISRWQLILDCSSRRDDNTQVSCFCVSKNLKIRNQKIESDDEVTEDKQYWTEFVKFGTWKIEVYVLGKSYEWPYSSFLNGGRLDDFTNCAGIRAGDCGTLQSWWTKR